MLIAGGTINSYYVGCFSYAVLECGKVQLLFFGSCFAYN